MRARSKDRVPARATRALGAALGVLTWVNWASACPNCDVGQTARALFWSDGFVANVLVVLVPFLVIAVVSVRADAIRHSGASSPISTPPGDEENVP